MRNNDTLDRQAPMSAHMKLDRLWLTREDQGQVSVTTQVKDPDSPSSLYYLTMTLSGVNE